MKISWPSIGGLPPPGMPLTLVNDNGLTRHFVITKSMYQGLGGTQSILSPRCDQETETVIECVEKEKP